MNGRALPLWNRLIEADNSVVLQDLACQENFNLFMNISLTSKDWLYKMELVPGPVLLMLCSVLMSSLHTQNTFPLSWASQFIVGGSKNVFTKG